MHADLRPVVVLIDIVTRSPHQARCSGFRLHLVAEFHLPLGAVFIFDLKLGRSPAFGFLDEFKVGPRLVFFPSRPVQEVQRRNIAPVAPQRDGGPRLLSEGGQRQKKSKNNDGKDPLVILHNASSKRRSSIPRFAAQRS